MGLILDSMGWRLNWQKLVQLYHREEESVFPSALQEGLPPWPSPKQEESV